MFSSLNNLSPEEKIKRFKELNSIPGENSYANFSPAAGKSAAVSEQPFPTIDFTSMVQDKLPINILAPGKQPKAEETTGKEPEDPYKQFKLGMTDPKMMNGPFKAPHVSDNVREAYKYYVQEKKLPAHVAAGIVGNLYQESRLKPTAVEKGNTQAGRGIAQWDKDVRWPSLEKWAKAQGKDPLDLKTQLDYVLIEPGWGDEALKRTMGTKTAADATMVFGKYFERPNEKYAQWDVRKGVADTLSNIAI